MCYSSRQRTSIWLWCMINANSKVRCTACPIAEVQDQDHPNMKILDHARAWRMEVSTNRLANTDAMTTPWGWRSMFAWSRLSPDGTTDYDCALSWGGGGVACIGPQHQVPQCTAPFHSGRHNAPVGTTRRGATSPVALQTVMMRTCFRPMPDG